jgi:hypothetical protein
MGTSLHFTPLPFHPEHISNLYLMFKYDVLCGSRSRGGIVGIATGYRLDDLGLGVRVPVGSKIFFFHVVLTVSGVHPASGTTHPVLKRPGREANHSPPANAEDKKFWINTFTPP